MTDYGTTPNSNPSAFPVTLECEYTPGMTLWDYYMAHALSGCVVNCAADEVADTVALACKMADEALLERQRRRI